MDFITAWFENWFAYSWAQVADSSFWWGALTALLGIVGLAALPAFRGAVGPLVGFATRLFTGYYFYWLRSYPDIISGTQHILLRKPDGSTEFCLDTIFGERHIASIMQNPYRAYLMRQTADFATKEDPLIRINEYGPKRRRWFRKRLTAARIRALREKIRYRYRGLYAPLVGAYAQFYTNPGSLRASRGEIMEKRRIIIAKTYTGAQRHHRVHGIHEEALLNWPETCPPVARPGYRERHELTLWLKKMYRRTPWRFDFVDEFAPVEEVNFSIDVTDGQRSRVEGPPRL